MRKFLISAAILSAVAVTGPAFAHYGQYDRGYGFNQGRDIPQQLSQISDRIERLRERRLVSRDEARRLHNEVERIDRRFDDYRRGGLSRWEHQELQQRIQNLRHRVQAERQEGRRDRWDDRRDRW